MDNTARLLLIGGISSRGASATNLGRADRPGMSVVSLVPGLALFAGTIYRDFSRRRP